MANMCRVETPPLLNVKGTGVTYTGVGVITDSIITIPVDGYYNIRISFQIYSQAFTQGQSVQTDFIIAQNNATINANWRPIQHKDYGSGVGGSQKFASYSLENVALCVAGDEISLKCSDYFNDTPGNTSVSYSIYVDRIGDNFIYI